MKKTILALGSLLAMGLGMSTTVQPKAPSTNETTVSSKTDNNQTEKNTVNDNMKNEKSYNFKKAYEPMFMDYKPTCPPKQYGMWLQQNRRQKWTKKRK
jgi:flagellar basal body L-ring protein FlgH